MNIHIKDKVLVDNLNHNTITQFLVGSHLYGLDNDKSDKDYLSVYFDLNYGIEWEHHQLQYKDLKNNIDYNFTSIQNFIRNILTGDSTINFELLYSNELVSSELGFLSDFKEHFRTYNIVISYLGLAKRDFKLLSRQIKTEKKLSYINEDVSKKMCHFLRGYIFAKMILENNFSLTMQTKNLEHTFTTDQEFLYKIKANYDGICAEKYFIEYLNYINDVELISLRNLVNKLFEKKEISRYMGVETLAIINENVINLNKSLSNKYQSINYGDLYLNALENGIEYDKE